MEDIEFVTLIDTGSTLTLLDEKLVGNNSTNRELIYSEEQERYNMRLQHYLRTR